MAPTDPRVLGASREAIQLDLELDYIVKGDEPWECKPCGGWTYRDRCPWCGVNPSALDGKLEALIAREARGEVVSFEEYERLWMPTRVSTDG